MKSLLKIFIITAFTFFITSPIIAQTNTGSLALNNDECIFDQDGFWYYDFVIKVSPNTPIKINYTSNTYDYFVIYTNDNGIYNWIVSTSEPTDGEQSCTIISSTGTIHIYCEYGWNGMDNDPIFSLNYSMDPNFSINKSTVIQNDEYIGGKLGIGIQPTEKLEVYGNVIIRGKSTTNSSLTNGTSTVYGSSYLSGNVGIGIVNANANGNAKLDIRGNALTSYINFAGAGVGNIKMGTTGGIGEYGSIWMSQSAPSGINYTFLAGGGLTIINAQKDEPLYFTEANVAKMILKSGNVGIGTTIPKAKLEVFNTATSGHLILSTNDNGSADLSRIDLDYKIANQNQTIARISSGYPNSANGGSGILRFYTSNSGVLGEKMRINANGNVSIGTTEIDPTEAMLTVNGSIHTKEVIVDLKPPLADYVFTPTYKLMPLYQVEQFVNVNSHLPEMPSAAEVSKNGLNMGEMQNKLLQKVEELTLYMIDQQKTINQQSAKIEELEKKLK